MDVEIPANTSATIYIPAAATDAVSENGEALSSSKSIHVERTEDGYVVVTAGSGIYHFTVKK